MSMFSSMAKESKAKEYGQKEEKKTSDDSPN